MATAGVFRVSFAITVAPFGNCTREGARPRVGSGWPSGLSKVVVIDTFHSAASLNGVPYRIGNKPTERAIRHSEHFFRNGADFLTRRSDNPLRERLEHSSAANRFEVSKLVGDIRDAVLIEDQL